MKVHAYEVFSYERAAPATDVCMKELRLYRPKKWVVAFKPIERVSQYPESQELNFFSKDPQQFIIEETMIANMRASNVEYLGKIDLPHSLSKKLLQAMSEIDKGHKTFQRVSKSLSALITAVGNPK